jgi:riboflavin kinase/FMN adenylyltransferase
MSEVRIYRSVEEASGSFPPSALTIGNFDGVHVGHRELFRQLVETGKRIGAKPSVLTFDPHPARVVAPHRAPKLLSTLDQRFAWMESSGIQQILVLPFDDNFAKFTPEEFVRRILVDAAGARAVLVGENFRFGNKQAGDTALLAKFGRRYGFTIEVVGGVKVRGRTVSSTDVRRLVEAGNVAWAARLLGRTYSLEGSVVHGHGVGSKQTVPTLNLATAAEVLPARGVYVTRTVDLDTRRRWPSVTNVGVRPTFGGDDAVSIETYLLEGYSDPPPSRIGVEFLLRLRPERKFPDVDTLKRQILRDAGRAKAYHRRVRRWVHC